MYEGRCEVRMSSCRRESESTMGCADGLLWRVNLARWAPCDRLRRTHKQQCQRQGVDGSGEHCFDTEERRAA